MGMLVLLSPAKTLDFSETDITDFTQPRLLDQSEKLVGVLKKKRKTSLQKLMNISEQLADLNVKRYQHFETPFNAENAKQSLLAFKGDVYTGLEAETFDADDRAFAQKYIRILSGLYGVLRPLDLMQPYRLEMGTKLSTRRGKNLYEFWKDRITKLLNEDLAENGDDVVVNLASNEYFNSVQPKKLAAKVLKVDFKEDRNGTLRVISFNAKKARGIMASQIVRQRLETPESLKQLDVDGYLFRDDLSSEDHFVFVK
jgi:cytoplasmic iron level regulating protein YaaA (DUF328/UPF0246 family)